MVGAIRNLGRPGVCSMAIAAVDLALGKLEMQVRRHKEKIQDRRRTPSAGEVAGAPPAAEAGEQ